jgi:hypothetical protein
MELHVTLPPEFAELSPAVRRDVTNQILRLHVKLLDKDAEYEGCVDNGRHLKELFNILASGLSHRRDFRDLIDKIPELIEDIRGQLDWKFPTGGPQIMRALFLEGRIQHWRLEANGPAKRKSAPNQAAVEVKLSKVRSEWLDEKKGELSDLDIEKNGGPTYNTIARWRAGKKSNRDAYVRGKLAKALNCDLQEVPK